MGCHHSSGVDARGRPSAAPPMTKREIDARIESSDDTRTATFGGVSVRYAYLSQRGYYPDEPSKANQDTYTVTHNFAGHPTDAFLGVFDGHGRDGDKCAQFARDQLPRILAERRGAAAEDAALTKEATHAVLTRAHRECNAAMRADRTLDDSLSGTTAISLYLQGRRNRITVSNVGDSRAVVGRAAAAAPRGEGATTAAGTTAPGAPPPSPLKAFALSRDQTPYRRDERVRIRRTGARVLSLDQIEGLAPVDEGEAARDEARLADGADDDDGGELVLGEEIDEGGDPPRVWSPDGDYPGTAFSRSLGDAVAEELGVVAVPEIVTREVTPEDRIIVLASDGVFEFLTNQSVIDICAKFDDPLEACRAVVAESYELWLQYELRTDDITMICLFVDAVDASVPDRGAAGSVHEEEEDAPFAAASRPVRTHMSEEKSRALAEAKARVLSDVTVEDEEDFDLASLYTDKTDEQKAHIDRAIQASVVFRHITPAQRELIYKAMEPMAVTRGQWIVRQGTVGDRFYVVDEGSFEVRILPEGREDADGKGGDAVHVYTGSRERHAHPSFGELALKHSAPRAASIVAQTDGRLWALHRYAFRQITEGARQDT